VDGSGSVTMASKALQRQVRKALKEAQENFQRFYDETAVVLTNYSLRCLDNFLESVHNKEKGENVMATKVLVCDCGDCRHWEVVQKEGGETVLKCKTCEHEFPATVDAHEKLSFIDHEA
jgi:uncharacterized CHY-type Zn-finger protein